MEKDLISVIIPVYNGEKYIQNVLFSLNRQIYNNYEIIFIDDGSTDKTGELLKNCALMNENIEIITQKNAGVSSARNAGLDVANGEFICFIDVDDEININYLSILHQVITSNNADMVICKMTHTTEQKNTVESASELKVFNNKDKFLTNYLYGRLKTGVWASIIRHDIIKSNYLRFKEGYKYSEDLHMEWRLLQFSNVIVTISNPLYIYRLTSNSAMDIFTDDRLHSIILMQDLVEFFKEKNQQFYKKFARFGVSRIAWAVLWQAARYLDYEDFSDFLKKSDFKLYMARNLMFPNLKIILSSLLFCISSNLYYFIVRKITFNYRR